MLNYIWAGLIIVSLVFALVSDGRDLAQDTYRNDQPFPAQVVVPTGYDPLARRVAVTVRVDPAMYRAHYGVEQAPDSVLAGSLIQSPDGKELRFAKDVALPEPWATIRRMTSQRENDLRGPVSILGAPGDSVVTAALMLPPVRFVKLNAITAAALDFAGTAVTIVLGLIGTLALWLGLLRIAEASGLINVIVRLAAPVIRPLFPEVPRDHPALGMIVLNLSANMLGLGNAATPLGIKAMEELQTLNPAEDTATNSMVMLLALNTASVQIVPPVLLVAIMGLQVNQLWFSIMIATAVSALVAIVATRGLGRLARYRRTDPMRPPAADGEG